MKRYLILCLCCILVLVGCSHDTVPAETLPQVTPETLPDPAIDLDSKDLYAVSVPAVSETVVLEDGTELYTHTAQHMQLTLPSDAIADKIILDFLNRVDAGQADAENVLAAAQNDYDPSETWFPYFYQTLYSPTRIDHGVLSLFGTRNSFSGGMHGIISCVSANYDLTTGDVLTLGSIMHADAEKEDFISLILEKLDSIKEESYLFDDYEAGVRNRLDVDENLYEDFYFSDTGLCFFFAPYEIAPYASGIITVELSYSELPGYIYDGYFPAEREAVHGTMHTGSFMETDMEQFNNMAEVNLSRGEEIMVAYPEGTVENIRITIPGNGMNIPDYTVFAAFEMSEKNAVVISLPFEAMDGVLITYASNGTISSIPLVS